MCAGEKSLCACSMLMMKLRLDLKQPAKARPHSDHRDYSGQRYRPLRVQKSDDQQMLQITSRSAKVQKRVGPPPAEALMRVTRCTQVAVAGCGLSGRWARSVALVPARHAANQKSAVPCSWVLTCETL